MMTRAKATKILTISIKVLIYIVLSLGAVSMIGPFLWTFVTSIKPSPQIIQWPPTFIPHPPTVEHYARLFSKHFSFMVFLLNSLFITSCTTLCNLFMSSIGGYVFAKFRFVGKELLFLLILATLIVPFQIYMVPFYLMIAKIGWIDTYQGIMAPLLVSSFGIFFMRQNMESIPYALIDSARIDGCSEFGIYLRIILPLTKAPLGALGIFLFMSNWSVFIWPLIVTNSISKYTLELGLALFQQQHYVEYGPTMAASSFVMIPALIVFAILRRHIVEGITLTGLKF